MANDITIALWGPSRAGKTAYLAQLFLKENVGSGWKVFPTSESREFLLAVSKRANLNFFPEPTDTVRNVRYRFKNEKTGQEAVLFVEDRAGRESSQLDDEGKRRLNQADGLILLFDPMRKS